MYFLEGAQLRRTNQVMIIFNQQSLFFMCIYSRFDLYSDQIKFLEFEKVYIFQWKFELLNYSIAEVGL